MAEEKTWRRIRGADKIDTLPAGVLFKNGVRAQDDPRNVRNSLPDFTAIQDGHILDLTQARYAMHGSSGDMGAGIYVRAPAGRAQAVYF